MSDMIEEMSKDELFSLWGETQDGDIPSNRSKNSPLNSFYPLTDYFVTVEDNKPIAAIGYSKKGEFTLFGGVFSTRRGEFSKLYDHFMSTNYSLGLAFPSIPYIACPWQISGNEESDLAGRWRSSSRARLHEGISAR